MTDQTFKSDTIRLRAILLGLALALIICAITPFNNSYRHGTPLGGGHFPLAPFFVLVWLTILIAVFARLTRTRHILTGKELLTSWILMVFSSGISYTGLVRTFFINLTAPYYFASVGNRWGEIIQPLLPKAWYPHDQQAVETFYQGLVGGREMGWWEVLHEIPWGVWIGPLALWGGFILLCYFVMVCVVNLFSRQWIHNERMNFPLLQVPMAIEDALDNTGLGRFLFNPYLLIGILVPVALHLVNGLSFYYPSIPKIPTLLDAGAYFPQYGLFSSFTKLRIYFYPAFIGFAFLAPRQISFSIWVFFFMGGLLIGLLSVLGYNIPAAALGVTFGPNVSRPEETQMLGAYGIFFIFILWLARKHIIGVFRQAVGLEPARPAQTEWFRVDYSLWGFVIGSLVIIGWLVYFGLPIIPAFLLAGAFFMVTLVASRIICQGGIAYFTLTNAPMDGILNLFGPGFFTHIGLLVAAVVQKVLFVDYRESLMPSLVHASKANAMVRSRRLLLIGIGVTLVGSVAVSFLAMLSLCYKYGVRELQLEWSTQTTMTVLENVRTLIDSPPQPGHWVTIFMLAGALVMLGLVICYHRFHWWPLHPIGYLTAYSSGMRILWFSFFVGWLVNAVCMRYGGVNAFKKLRLYFIGMVIGDFLMGGVWAIIGLFSYASYLVLPD